jgi:hypothetical protein
MISPVEIFADTKQFCDEKGNYSNYSFYFTMKKINAWCDENCKNTFRSTSWISWEFDDPTDAVFFKLYWT